MEEPQVRVVVGVDGSPTSLAALRWAADEARRRGAVLDVVLAWELSVPPRHLPRSVAELTDEVLDELRQSLESILVEAGVTDDEDLSVRSHVVAAPASRAVLEAAEGATLLVLGATGHSALVDAALGSVTWRCLQHAPCPVVVVPSRR